MRDGRGRDTSVNEEVSLAFLLFGACELIFRSAILEKLMSVTMLRPSGESDLKSGAGDRKIFAQNLSGFARMHLMNTH